jgi:hypothetical protein
MDNTEKRGFAGGICQFTVEHGSCGDEGAGALADGRCHEGTLKSQAIDIHVLMLLRLTENPHSVLRLCFPITAETALTAISKLGAPSDLK